MKPVVQELVKKAAVVLKVTETTDGAATPDKIYRLIVKGIKSKINRKLTSCGQ